MPLPKNPQDVIPYVKLAEATALPEEYRSMREQVPDIGPIFDALKDRAEIKSPDIIDYVKSQKQPLNKFDSHLLDLINAMQDPTKTDQEKVEINKSLDALAHYMIKRNGILQNSQERLEDMHDKVVSSGLSPEQLPKVDTYGVVNKLKDGLKGVGSAFSNAKTVEDKLIILGGIGISVMLLAKLFTAKNSVARGVRNVAGLLGGGYVLWQAFNVVNRSTTLTTGKPIVNLGESTEKFDEKQYQKQLRNAVEELRARHIDDAFITKMMNRAGKEDLPFVKGITNFGSLNVGDFLDRYEKSKGEQMVRDELWPDYPCEDSEEFPQHNLKPAERFFTLRDMATTLGFIDAAGNVKNDISEETKRESVFYVILNRK